MQRYFVQQKDQNKFLLSKEDTYHIKTVMRMSLHDQIEIIYDQKIYISEIIELDPIVKTKIIQEIIPSSELSSRVTIAQALVKEQKMDYILQKTTELGVSEIIPYCAEHCIIKLEQKEKKKIERWQKIVKEAAEQSKRVEIPKVNTIMKLSDLIHLSNYDKKFLCTVNETSKNMKKLLSNISESDRILFVIGPEGGFTEQEEKLLLEHGFFSLSLGKTVLRTETASTFIMSVIRYLNME